MTTATLDRRRREIAPFPRATTPGRVRTWAIAHRTSLLVGTPLILIAGAVHIVGMYAAPTLVDDEGTYTAQAWAIEHWHTLAHYTYWYDHPPVGWVQIAGWTWLTGAFERNGLSAMAGREAMAVAKVVSLGLVFLLARRVGMNRVFAGVAVVLFGLSPLAMEFSRSVYLDNIAVPWLLAAFAVATSPRRSLLAAAASSACFVVAVMSKETTLVLLPALVLALWQNADRRTRRLTLSVAATLFVAGLVLYPLYALLRGELMEGEGHVSLLWAVKWQLFSRPSSGTVLDPSSPARNVVDTWLRSDSVLLVASVLTLPFALVVRRLRPIGVALGVQLVMLLRDGYLPFPYVIALAPFAALVVAGALDAGWTATDRWRGAAAGRLLRGGGAAVGVVAAIALVPVWQHGLARQTEVDHVAPTRHAVEWLEHHAPRDSVIIVEDTIWVDLVERGFDPDRVIWFFKYDLDPAVRLPDGWRDVDYIATSPSSPDEMRSLPKNRQAVLHSRSVATYGDGPDRIVVRKIMR
jgi:hypothetical protein